MHKVKGQQKNQKIGKAGVAIAVALIFSSTFSGDIQTFLQAGLVAKDQSAAAVELQKQPVQSQPLVQSQSTLVEVVEEQSTTATKATETTSVEPSTETESAIKADSAASIPEEQDEPVTPAEVVQPKPAAPKLAAKPAPKPATKPRESVPAPVARVSPPQIVYQADLLPVPTFSAPPAVAEKPLKFNAPAKAVRELPRAQKVEEPTPAKAQDDNPAVPAGVYSLNTAPTNTTTQPAVELAAPKKTPKPMPTVKTQVGDKAVLAMPDGSTRVVAVGESIPGFGVVSKLTKSEVIFGVQK